MRISDWSADVCSSDLPTDGRTGIRGSRHREHPWPTATGGRHSGRRPVRRRTPAGAPRCANEPATADRAWQSRAEPAHPSSRAACCGHTVLRLSTPFAAGRFLMRILAPNLRKTAPLLHGCFKLEERRFGKECESTCKYL